jgi:hypothetical protein
MALAGTCWQMLLSTAMSKGSAVRVVAGDAHDLQKTKMMIWR